MFIIIRYEVDNMDKRIEKTKTAIYDAFKATLDRKPYADITIQDILDESKISRSTFYSHFKTKEEVLKSLCSSIFRHVFSHSLEEEKSHDFSKSSIFDYKHLITHIFYHIHDNHEIIDAIFKSESKDVFLNEMRYEIKDFANAMVANHYIKEKSIPSDLRSRGMVESFIITLEYWINNLYKETPELLTEYFITLNN